MREGIEYHRADSRGEVEERTSESGWRDIQQYQCAVYERSSVAFFSKGGSHLSTASVLGYTSCPRALAAWAPNE